MKGTTVVSKKLCTHLLQVGLLLGDGGLQRCDAVCQRRDLAVEAAALVLLRRCRCAAGGLQFLLVRHGRRQLAFKALQLGLQLCDLLLCLHARMRLR